MGIEDRDWYRAEFNRRRAAAERAARPQWDKVERPHASNGATPSAAGLRFGPLGWLTVIAICLITAHREGVIGQAWSPGLAVAAGQPPGSDKLTVPFPSNGATTMYVTVDLAASAPLTLQTPATEPKNRFVVSVRDWVTDKVVATVYLETNTVVTLDLPAGRYRVLVAAGHQWSGDRFLFGRLTRVVQVRDPISLERYGSRAVGHVLYFMDTSNPNLWIDQVPVSRFSTQ
jgi:hypothetical protein